MPSGKEIFINVTAGDTRIAIVEDGNLCDLFIELPDHQRTVGNIYKGKIQNVIPGMEAAFIDIGLDTNAFLPFTEIGNLANLENLSIDDEDENSNYKSTKSINPAKDLKIGNDILVQVIKEPFYEKGARVSTDISIPGNLIVLVPDVNYIGISKKIQDKYEKRRLRTIIKSLKPKNFGIIVRTIAEGKDEKLIIKDFNKTWQEWKNLNKNMKNSSPFLIYKDFETSQQVIRDLFNNDIQSLYIDSKELYKKIYNYLVEINPDKSKIIKLFKEKSPIFNKYNINNQIDKCLKRKVWLKSGANLMIEHTEAMVVIDINSGKFIGKANHERNSLAINVEAAIEIARQLRIRDIGGLIVIDFIDLQEEKNKKKVFKVFKDALYKDRAKVALSEFSNFGILEMTRQRIRLDLFHTLTDLCFNCNGRGRVLSKDSVLTNLENWLKSFRMKFSDKRLIIYMHPELVTYITSTRKKLISGFMWSNWMWLELKENSSLSIDEFRIYSKKRKKDVTSEV